jgi:hypothetical protein
MMSMPASHPNTGPLAEFVERHDTLRMIMEWIADRLADAPEIDDSIAWEDGEEHDEPQGPATL